jgi:hypothetical protein
MNRSGSSSNFAPPFGMWSLLDWPSYANCVIACFVALARKMSAPRVSI